MLLPSCSIFFNGLSREYKCCYCNNKILNVTINDFKYIHIYENQLESMHKKVYLHKSIQAILTGTSNSKSLDYRCLREWI